MRRFEAQPDLDVVVDVCRCEQVEPRHLGLQCVPVLLRGADGGAVVGDEVDAVSLDVPLSPYGGR